MPSKPEENQGEDPPEDPGRDAGSSSGGSDGADIERSSDLEEGSPAQLEDLGAGYYRDPSTGEIYDSLTGDWFPPEAPAPDQPFTVDQLDGRLPDPVFTVDQLGPSSLEPVDDGPQLDPWAMGPKFNPDAGRSGFGGTSTDLDVTNNGYTLPTAAEFAFYIRQPRSGDPPLAGDPNWMPNYAGAPDTVFHPVLPPKPDNLFYDPGMPPTLPPKLVFTPPPVIRPPTLLPPKPVFTPPIDSPFITPPATAPTSTSGGNGAGGSSAPPPASSSGWLVAAAIVGALILMANAGAKSSRD